MSRKVELELDEVKEVFLLLEEMNAFFHQPMHFDDSPQTEEFAGRIYPELHRLFYKVTWNWLPPDVQKEFEDRPSPFEK
jgi:hypothetical protein